MVVTRSQTGPTIHAKKKMLMPVSAKSYPILESPRSLSPLCKAKDDFRLVYQVNKLTSVLAGFLCVSPPLIELKFAS